MQNCFYVQNIYPIYLEASNHYGSSYSFPWTHRTSSVATEKSEIETALAEGLMDVRGKIDDISRSVSDYFPMIKRGFIGEEKEEGAPEVVTVGWKHDVTSRKEREEGLR